MVKAHLGAWSWNYLSIQPIKSAKMTKKISKFWGLKLFAILSDFDEIKTFVILSKIWETFAPTIFTFWDFEPKTPIFAQEFTLN